MTQRINNQDSKIFIAKKNNDIIGFCQLYPSFSSVSLQKIYILNDLFVKKNFRNQNIATKLMNKVKEYCQQEKISKIFLRKDKNNVSAKNLYKKNNFIKDDIFEDYFFNL